MRVSGTFERVACCEGGEIGWGEEKGSYAEVCGFGRGFARFEEGEAEVVRVVVGAEDGHVWMSLLG